MAMRLHPVTRADVAWVADWWASWSDPWWRHPAFDHGVAIPHGRVAGDVLSLGQWRRLGGRLLARQGGWSRAVAAFYDAVHTPDWDPPFDISLPVGAHVRYRFVGGRLDELLAPWDLDGVDWPGPGFLWPQDRSWLLLCSPDLSTTYVLADASTVDDLLSTDGLGARLALRGGRVLPEHVVTPPDQFDLEAPPAHEIKWAFDHFFDLLEEATAGERHDPNPPKPSPRGSLTVRPRPGDHAFRRATRSALTHALIVVIGAAVPARRAWGAAGREQWSGPHTRHDQFGLVAVGGSLATLLDEWWDAELPWEWVHLLWSADRSWYIRADEDGTTTITGPADAVEELRRRLEATSD